MLKRLTRYLVIVILVTALSVAGVSFWRAYTTPKMYRARAILQLRGVSRDRIHELGRIATSGTVLERTSEAIETLGMVLRPFDVLSQTKIVPSKKNNRIVIAVTTKRPQEAEDTANMLAYQAVIRYRELPLPGRVLIINRARAYPAPRSVDWKGGLIVSLCINALLLAVALGYSTGCAAGRSQARQTTVYGHYKRYLVIVVIVTALSVAAISYWKLYATPKMYKARTALMLRDAEGRRIRGFTQINEFIKVARSRAVAERTTNTCRQLGMVLDPTKVLSRSTIKRVKDTDLVAVDFLSSNCGEAQDMANVLRLEASQLYKAKRPDTDVQIVDTTYVFQVPPSVAWRYALWASIGIIALLIFGATVYVICRAVTRYWGRQDIALR